MLFYIHKIYAELLFPELSKREHSYHNGKNNKIYAEYCHDRHSGRESKSSVMCMCKHIYVNGEFITSKYTYVGRMYYIPNKTPITV